MRDDRRVRTTLDIDDDLLQAAKELGAMQKKTAGQVLSELARKGLYRAQKYTVRNGVPVIHRKPGSPVITSADVRRWMDEDL
jgi:hypothetical protein